MGEVACEVREYARYSGGRGRTGAGIRMAVCDGSSRRRSVARDAPRLRNLARDIVEEYVTHYNDFDRPAGRSADLSAIKLEEIPGLVDAFRVLVEKLKTTTAEDEEAHNKLLLAHWYAQTYKFDQYVDLKDLCIQIKKQLPARLAPRMRRRHPMHSTSAFSESGCSGFA